MSKTNKIHPKLLEVRKVLTLGRVCLEGYTRGHGVVVTFCVLIRVLVTWACSTVSVYQAKHSCALSVCNILYQ